jgi:predicted dehydrogenase
MLPALLRARQVVQSGAIGNLVAIHCDFYFSKDAGPPKGTRQPGDPPINWLERQIEAHADGSDGGVGVQPMGELQVEGIYPLAYIRMLAGRTVERVFARTTAHFHQAHVDNNVDDLATVTLEMEGGVVGSLCIGRIGAASHPDIGEIKLHLLGTKGAIVVAEARPEISVHYRGQPANEFRHIRVANENDYLLVEDFANAIDSGTSTLLDARAGRDICAVVEACVRSGTSGTLEEVDNTFGK